MYETKMFQGNTFASLTVMTLSICKQKMERSSFFSAVALPWDELEELALPACLPLLSAVVGHGPCMR